MAANNTPLFTNLIIQDGGHLRTFNARKKETLFIIFYATVEICLRNFSNARFTYVNIYASVEIHLKGSVWGFCNTMVSVVINLPRARRKSLSILHFTVDVRIF